MNLTIVKWLLNASVLLAMLPAFGQEAINPGADVPQTEQPKSPTPPTTPPLAAESTDEFAVASNDQYDVLMSGPIHEAFAEPNAQADAKPLIVTRAPPEPIDEVPPAVQPEGENIEWIPGYWGWDQNTDDFVWVTGLWRQTPPDRQWVPGYWNQVGSGYQWVSGFWADQNVAEVAYLPPPPDAPEAAPSTPQPGDNYFWVPGQWNYDNTQYQWQAGYWAQHNPDWIWVNTTYLSTPQGYVCRSGYWDYQLGYRGTIFCPVRFNSGYSGSYRPNYVMNVGVNWLANLFVHPGYRHYYFGNYYGARSQQNLYPWVSYYQGHRYYDPLYSYYRAGHQNYITQVNQLHRRYVQQQQFRPAATVTAQQKQEKEMGQNNSSLAFNTATIASLAVAGNQFVKANNGSEWVDSNAAFQFKKLDEAAMNQVNATLKPVKELQQQRRIVEQTHPAAVANNLTGGKNNNSAKSNTEKTNTPKGNVVDNTKPATGKENTNNKLKLPTSSTGRGQIYQNTGLLQNQAGNRGGIRENPGAQTPAKGNARAKAGEAGKDPGNPVAGDLKGQGNAGVNNKGAGSSSPRTEIPGNNVSPNLGGVLNGNASVGVRQPPINSPAPGAGKAAIRNIPPRGSVPNLPPVPHDPVGAGKAGGLLQGGGAKPNRNPGNTRDAGGKGGARGGKKQ